MRYDLEIAIRARLERGFSKSELARRIKKSTSTIVRIEKGEFSNPKTMKLIADELGLKMKDLILEE